MGTEEVISGSASDAWLEQLRARFTEIAARRVDPAAVDDIVQDALGVILEKSDGKPKLEWCFQVLRNVIGNWYRREKTRRRFVVSDPEGEADAATAEVTALEALESQEAVAILRSGVAALGEPCSGYLAGLMGGATPAHVAEGEGLEAAVFYRRLYRCRQKLREWLKLKGVEA
jgi:DNA-directed RNA polymerase specialized sigma24 family protein